MSEFETPAAVETEAPPSPAPAKEPEITPEMLAAAQGGVSANFAKIREQPKVRVRVPKVYGPQVVIINGARFNVPCNIPVEVPEQVAQILADAGRI